MKMPSQIVAWVVASAALSCHSFVPTAPASSSASFLASSVTASDIDIQATKPTGTSFLPEETVERAQKGSPIEKIKLAKDGTAAFVDVYDFARKIREGEMTWEEVEKADLDTVREGCIILTSITYLDESRNISHPLLLVLSSIVCSVILILGHDMPSTFHSLFSYKNKKYTLHAHIEYLGSFPHQAVNLQSVRNLFREDFEYIYHVLLYAGRA